jgi:hypothetical protein
MGGGSSGGETNTYRLFVFLEDFLEICANTCSRKLLVVAKESENIQLRNAELKTKWVKCANVQIYCVLSLSRRVNISRDIKHSGSTRTFGE